MFRPEYAQKRRFNTILIFAALVMLMLFSTGEVPIMQRLFPKEKPGTGLAIENVAFETAHEAAESALVVRGTVRNITDQPRVVPGILVTLLDSEGEPLTSRYLGSMSRVLTPGEGASFFADFAERPKGAKSVNVTFKASPPKASEATTPLDGK